MKQFKIKVNGKEYLVEVEEIGTGNTSSCCSSCQDRTKGSKS